MVIAILPLLLLLLIAGLVTGIVMWSTSGSGGSEMSCGRCGYAVRGLTQLNCPECGADLREAGIRPTGSPGRRTTGIVLTLGSAGILLLGCVLSVFLFAAVPSSTSFPASQTLQPSIAQPQPVQTIPPANTPTTPDHSGTDQSHPDQVDTR